MLTYHCLGKLPLSSLFKLLLALPSIYFFYVNHNLFILISLEKCYLSLSSYVAIVKPFKLISALPSIDPICKLNLPFFGMTNHTFVRILLNYLSMFLLIQIESIAHKSSILFPRYCLIDSCRLQLDYK